MRPETIQKREDEFFSNLTNSAGVKYKLTQTTDIGHGIKIYSIRPDFTSYYYNTKTTKKSICLHFTVGYIKSDTTALSTKDNCVSVSYVVDRSGRIYEMFPDTEWSYHLGSGAVGGNGAMSKQSIGIEISNYGPLKLSGENLIDAYKNEYCKVSETQFYDKLNYRGYDYFASMTEVQISATAALIKYLGRKHDIPMNFMPSDAPFANNAEALAFKGVFYHTNVRKDKFDWPFGPSLKSIIAACTNVLPQAEEAKADATKTAAPSEATKVAEPAQKPAEASMPVETPKAEVKAAEVKKSPEIKPAAKQQASKPKTTPVKAPSLLGSIISLLLQLLGGKKR
jgi:hypothetical protein